MNIKKVSDLGVEFIESVISDPGERKAAVEKIRKLSKNEIDKMAAKLDSNASFFVSGAIPSILWVLVIVMLFNFIVFPLLNGTLGLAISFVEIPEWYSSMCSTIVLGLLAKKAWDGSQFSGKSFSKRSKYEIENEAAEEDSHEEENQKNGELEYSFPWLKQEGKCNPVVTVATSGDAAKTIVLPGSSLQENAPEIPSLNPLEVKSENDTTPTEVESISQYVEDVKSTIENTAKNETLIDTTASQEKPKSTITFDSDFVDRKFREYQENHKV